MGLPADSHPVAVPADSHPRRPDLADPSLASSGGVGTAHTPDDRSTSSGGGNKDAENLGGGRSEAKSAPRGRPREQKQRQRRPNHRQQQQQQQLPEDGCRAEPQTVADSGIRGVAQQPQQQQQRQGGPESLHASPSPARDAGKGDAASAALTGASAASVTAAGDATRVGLVPTDSTSHGDFCRDFDEASPYLPVAYLGRGAVGRVFHCIEKATGDRVAVKVVGLLLSLPSCRCCCWCCSRFV